MRAPKVYQAVVEQSMECVPLLEIAHGERVNGVDYVISHTLRRNVFTEFDGSLSRHLAAIEGEGFPEISSSTRIAALGGEDHWQTGQPGTYAGLAEALRSIGGRALGDGESAELRMSPIFSRRPRDVFAGVPRVIGRGDLQALDAALAFCRQLGPGAFLEVSGDYDLMVVRPAGDSLAPVRMDLPEGTILIPLSGDSEVKGALFDVLRNLGGNRGVGGYLAAARHALERERSDAVLRFRAAAEEQVLELDRALGAGPITDYRVDAVQALVTRLKAGLGDGLRGLAEHAKITALDWASAIEEGRRPPPRDIEHPHITHRRRAQASRA